MEIKQWKKEQDEEFNEKYKSILNGVIRVEIDEKTAISRVEDLNLEYLEKYNLKYKS